MTQCCTFIILYTKNYYNFIVVLFMFVLKVHGRKSVKTVLACHGASLYPGPLEPAARYCT